MYSFLEGDIEREPFGKQKRASTSAQSRAVVTREQILCVWKSIDHYTRWLQHEQDEQLLYMYRTALFLSTGAASCIALGRNKAREPSGHGHGLFGVRDLITPGALHRITHRIASIELAGQASQRNTECV